MARSLSNKFLLGLAVLLNRLVLGLYFLLAGVGKISGGVGDFYHSTFLSLKPAWLPTALAAPYAYALPFLEVIVGALLIAGCLGRLAAGMATLMLISFTIALYSAGAFFAGPGPFHTNVVFIALALLLAAAGPGPVSLDALIAGAGRWRSPTKR